MVGALNRSAAFALTRWRRAGPHPRLSDARAPASSRCHVACLRRSGYFRTSSDPASAPKEQRGQLRPVSSPSRRSRQRRAAQHPSRGRDPSKRPQGLPAIGRRESLQAKGGRIPRIRAASPPCVGDPASREVRAGRCLRSGSPPPNEPAVGRSTPARASSAGRQDGRSAAADSIGASPLGAGDHGGRVARGGVSPGECHRPNSHDSPSNIGMLQAKLQLPDRGRF